MKDIRDYTGLGGWHAEGAQEYHVSKECSVSAAIPSDKLQPGKGELLLCSICKNIEEQQAALRRKMHHFNQQRRS